MGLRDLFGRAKKTVDDRGGVDSLKEDAEELRDIARGEGDMTHKAKEAAEAVKDPGAPGGEPARRAGGTTGAEPPRDAPGR
jgi:hypothetical protein